MPVTPNDVRANFTAIEAPDQVVCVVLDSILMSKGAETNSTNIMVPYELFVGEFRKQTTNNTVKPFVVPDSKQLLGVITRQYSTNWAVTSSCSHNGSPLFVFRPPLL